MRTRLRVLAVAFLVLSGCGDKGGSAHSVPVPPPPPDAAAGADAAPAHAETPLPAGFPDSVAGHQLAWVLDVIVARHGVIAADEIQAHFHPTFLAQVPVDQAIGVFKQLGEQLGELAVDTVTEVTAGSVKARVSAQGEKLRISLGIAPGTELIGGLLFQPDAELGAKPTSFANAIEMLPTLAPRAQMLVAQLDKGACKPLHVVKGRDELAVGSTFKLYVLLALVDQIIAGKLAWDTELAVRDDWKSLPSGITQDEAAGTKLTVRTLAERMISISDNTATDHLLYTVGRKKVEAAVKAAKHARPALDVPFLSTRELFLLKLSSAEDMEKYLALGAEKRRGFLDKTLAGKAPALDGGDVWTDPRKIDTLEWFASSEDLCRVMSTLAARAKKPAAAAVLDVLAKNPGLPIDAKVWPYIGFKGGSEPGVMNLTWLLRRDDDRWFVVSIGFNAPTKLEENKLLGFATGVLELLATEGR